LAISLKQRSKIETYVGLVTAILAITIILLPVDVEGLQVLPTSFDKSKYGVGDTPVVTIVSHNANLNPNEIDSINVSVKLLVFLSHAGVKIDTVTIQETAPNTGIFQGELPTISLQHMKHELTGKDNKFIQAVCSSGCGGSAFTQAELIQPSQPTSSGDTLYEKNGFSMKIPSNWPLNDQTSRDGNFLNYATITNAPGTSDAFIQIGKYEDQTPGGSHQEYLDEMYNYQKSLCESASFANEGFTCSNFSRGPSEYTVDVVTAYGIGYTALLTLSDGSTNPMMIVLTRLTDGNDTWELLGVTSANNPNLKIFEIIGTFKISGVMDKELSTLGESDDTSQSSSDTSSGSSTVSRGTIAGTVCPKPPSDYDFVFDEQVGFGESGTCYYKGYNPNIGTRLGLSIQFYYESEYPLDSPPPSSDWPWCTKNENFWEYISSTHYAYASQNIHLSGLEGLAKEVVTAIESQGLAIRCDGSTTVPKIPKPERTPAPNPAPKPAPKSSTDDLQDSRCPAKYPIYLEKYDLCQADIATDPRCTVDFPIFLEEHGVCAAAVRVSAINVTPLSALTDYSEIVEEGKRLVEDDKNYDKAILYFKKAIQLEPDNVVGFYNLAETLYNYGDKKASVEYYYKMLELSPNHLAAKRALQAMNLPVEPTKSSDDTKEQTEYDGWIKQGSYDLANRNYDEAIKNFDLAYKQNPNDQNLILLKSQALKKKGMALADDGKFDLAVVFLGESNYLKPDEFVKAIQNNAYNRWTEEIKKRDSSF